MYARQMLRPARAIQAQTKRYASTSTASSGGGAAPYIFGAVALGGGGYLMYRQRNSSAWKDAKDQAKSAADEAKGKARGVLDEAKEKAQGAVDSAKGAFDSAKGQAKGAAESAKGAVGSAADSASSGAGGKAFTGGDQGFVSLVLDKVDIINHNTKHFRFKLPNEDDVSGLEVASALLTKYKGPDMEKPVLRPYTPTSDEDEKGFLDLVIKRYPNGPMSEHLHNMEPGQSLDFKGPLPKYPWSPNKHEHITLIAGGTGITPMYQLCRAIFKNPEDKTKVTLVFGNLTEEDILLKREFEELENTYPRRFRAFYTLDNPTGTWSGAKGHITKELLKTVMPEPKEGDNIKVFVCGPPGLYKAVSGTKKSPKDQGELDGILKELGYSKEQVYKF